MSDYDNCRGNCHDSSQQEGCEVQDSDTACSKKESRSDYQHYRTNYKGNATTFYQQLYLTYLPGIFLPRLQM